MICKKIIFVYGLLVNCTNFVSVLQIFENVLCVTQQLLKLHIYREKQAGLRTNIYIAI